MTATPDGISMAELLALAEQARSAQTDDVQEDVVSNDLEGTICGMSVADYQKGVILALEKLNDEFSHPMTAKLVIMECLAALMNWHTRIGKSHFDVDGDGPECGTAWLRDAGKIQAAMNIIDGIELPDDFIAAASRR